MASTQLRKLKQQFSDKFPLAHVSQDLMDGLFDYIDRYQVNVTPNVSFP